jgi:phosphoesterase RecJ-like protein
MPRPSEQGHDHGDDQIADQGSHAAWTGNADAASMASWLKSARRTVLLTHFKPDGDAVGSTLAIARCLNLLKGGYGSESNAAAEVWYTGPLPPFLHELSEGVRIRHIDAQPFRADPGAMTGDEPDAIVITDTGAWSQLVPVRTWLASRRERVGIIDHHLTGDGEVGQRRLIETSAPAVCQTVAEVCVALLGVGSAADLPEEVARTLYLGIATDTGWFKHSNVTPDALRLVADLIETGVDHAALHSLVEQQDRPQRLKLLERALGRFEMLMDGRVAMMGVDEADVKETEAAPGESGGFIDMLLRIASVEVACVLTEVERASPEGAKTKVSLRSKEGPRAVDVSKVAQGLGGGGHARASGCRIPGTLTDARAKLLDALGPHFDSSPSTTSSGGA